MIELVHFHFIRPYCLALIPLVGAIWWMLRIHGDPLRKWRRIIEPELLEAMTIPRDPRGRWRDQAVLAAWVLSAIAIAGPTWRAEPSPFADDPVPVMLLLKSGESMNQSDLTPSRMERGRLKVIDFANQRKGQPLGLIAYAGSAHLVLPPTRDTNIVATMAAEISPEIMPKPGDDLATALDLAVETLGESGGSIVVIADTIDADNRSPLAQFRSDHAGTVQILGIARPETPESQDLANAASILKANLTMMTPDIGDIERIVRRVADTPIAVSIEGEGTHWAEAGWWLTPIIAAIVLLRFQRIESNEGLAT